MNRKRIAALRTMGASSLICFIPVFVVATAINFITLMPDGILAKTVGIGSTYRTDVMMRFESSQSYVMLAAMLISSIFAEAYHLGHSTEHSE